MPLNVQPLSLARRMIRLLVLLALLGLSLGFAQYLTAQRHAHTMITLDLAALGYPDALPESQPFPNEIAAGSGKVAGQLREVRVFYGQNLPTITEQIPAAVALFKTLLNAEPKTVSNVQRAGRLWAEFSGPIAPNSFAILRISTVDEHGLVICYSGVGPRTDADNSALDALCVATAKSNLAPQ